MNAKRLPKDRALTAHRVDRREFAPAQQEQARGQSAVAANPVAHHRGICLQHKFGCIRLGIHPAAPVDRSRGMKSQHRAAGRADAVVRYHAQHQRAGRQARSVDHDPFARGAHLLEQIEKRADLSALAAQAETDDPATVKEEAAIALVQVERLTDVVQRLLTNSRDPRNASAVALS